MRVHFISNFALNRRRVSMTALALILIAVFASPVYAHKVHIFAYVDGDLIKTESRFNGGRPARNCKVDVHSLNGQDVMVSGESDEQGLFAFPVPSQAVDIEIVITCGDGHRGSWRLEAIEYSPSDVNPAPHVHSSLPTDDHDNALLRKIIAEEIDEKLAPLRRDLARIAEKKTSLQDILGGIGYLLGLAGLAAYMKFKKTQ